MNIEKEKNIILKLGSRTIECGLEEVGKPLIAFNIHHFAELQNFHLTEFPNKDYPSSGIAINNTLIDVIKNDNLNFCHLFYCDLLIYEDLDVYFSDLRIHCKKILSKIFYKCGISTINAKLLLLQNENFPTVYTQLISDILLKDLFMRAVVILSTPLMVCIGSGSSNGIIIDIGWTRTTVVAVFDNRVLQNYTKFTNRAGFRLHYELLNSLKVEDLNIDRISFRDLENSITMLENIEDDSDKMITCGPYLVKKRVFSGVISELYFTNNQNCEDDELPIVELIAELIDGLPIDLKSILASRMIITGGISNFAGFRSKMSSKLNNRITQEVGEISSLGDWAGASIYSTIMKKLKKSDSLWEIRK